MTWRLLNFQRNLNLRVVVFSRFSAVSTRLFPSNGDMFDVNM